MSRAQGLVDGLRSYASRVRSGWPVWTAGVAALGFTLALLASYGTQPWPVLWYLAIFLFSVTGPGTLLLRAVHPRPRPLLADLAIGTAIGLIVQLALWALFVGVGLGAWMLAGSVAWYAVFLAIPRLRRCFRGTPDAGSLGPVSAWALAAAYAAALLSQSSNFTLALPPSVNEWYVDQYWHLGNAAGFLHQVASMDLRVAGQELVYHWFSNAHIAAGSLSTGLDLDLVLARLWLPPIIAAAIVLIATVTRQLAGQWWPGVLAAWMLGLNAAIVPTWFDVPGGGPLTANSPSQNYSLLVLLLILSLLIDLWRRSLSRAAWVLLALALLAAPGAKSSLLPILICALALGLLVQLLRRRAWRGTLAALGLAILALLVTLPFLGGGEAGVKLQLFSTIRRTPFYADALGLSVADQLFSRGPVLPGLLTVSGFLAAALVLGAYAVKYLWLWLGAPVLARREETPAAWVLLGLGIAGFSAAMLIEHDGMSQLYFFKGGLIGWFLLGAWGFSAIVGPRIDAARFRILALGGAVGYGGMLLWNSLAPVPLVPGRQYVSAAVGLAVVIVPFVVVVVLVAAHRHRDGSVVRLLLASALVGAALLPGTQQLDRATRADPSEYAVTEDEVAATRWVRDHTDPGDVLATNVHCIGPNVQPCDNRAFWISGFSQRAVLIEGWAYTDDAHARQGVDGRTYNEQPFSDQGLYALNESAFTDPTSQILEDLREHGVRYLFADSHRGEISDRLDDLADVAFSNDDVTVYRIPG